MKNRLMKKYKTQMILFLVIVIEAFILGGMGLHRLYMIKKTENAEKLAAEQASQNNVKAEEGAEAELQEEQTTLPERDPDAADNAYKTDDVRIVCLDPALGGTETGDTADVGSKMTESQYNLEFALLVKQELEKQDIQVYMTRTNDADVAKKDRTDLANNAYADLMVSITRDCKNDNQNNEGLSAWIHHSGSSMSNAAAKEILKYLENADAGVNAVKKGTNTSTSEDYWVNENCIGPSVVLGMGSVQNDDVVEDYDANKETYAKAVADAIVMWMENQGL